MMTPELEALGRRVVACGAWSYPANHLECLPVLNLRTGGRSTDDQCSIRDHEAGDVIPDLSSPLVLGWLLALVREAWGEPNAVAFPWGVLVANGEVLYRHWQILGKGRAVVTTEVEALVSALEAAPTRSSEVAP